MKTVSVSLQAAVRALMRYANMNEDEARRHLIQAIQSGKLPVYWEDTATKERGAVPSAALTRLH